MTVDKDKNEPFGRAEQIVPNNVMKYWNESNRTGSEIASLRNENGLKAPSSGHIQEPALR